LHLHLICEDSLEGIFTAISEAFATKRPADEIHLQVGEEGNYLLLAEYVTVAPDLEKSAQVARAAEKRFGAETYLMLCHALATEDDEKAEAVYRTIICGLALPKPTQIMNDLADPHVLKVFELARASSNECHHYRGFIRFRELANGILYARISPKSNVLTFVMPHFADRLPRENFVIHDEGRGLYGLHPAGKPWYVVTETEGLRFEAESAVYSKGEAVYGALFTEFCQAIAIEERENRDLQRQNLPLRFREGMTEWLT
jgi:probable DNA metabolism protein